MDKAKQPNEVEIGSLKVKLEEQHWDSKHREQRSRVMMADVALTAQRRQTAQTPIN